MGHTALQHCLSAVLLYCSAYHGDTALMTRFVAISNQKGGEGKTSTTANLAVALGSMGKSVLIVDLDPRGDLTSSLGIDGETLDVSVYEALFADGISLSDAAMLLPECENVAVVPANTNLAAAEMLLLQASLGERELVLATALSQVASDVDFVLIDTPPGLNLLTINALAAVREVIVPQQCSFIALHGLKQLQRTIDGVRDAFNPKLRLCGIVATMRDSRTVHHRQVIDMMRQAFGDVVFQTVIPASIRFQEAAVAGIPVVKYAPLSAGAIACRALAKEVLDRDPES